MPRAAAAAVRQRQIVRDRGSSGAAVRIADQIVAAQRPAPLELAQAMPLVERALQVLERRAVQPQLGLLKSTMLQLDPAFNERAYGASSFSDFVEKLKRAELVNVSGTGGRYIIERKGSVAAGTAESQARRSAAAAARRARKSSAGDRKRLSGGGSGRHGSRRSSPTSTPAPTASRQFTEFLNYAQDKTVVRLEPHEEQGMMVIAGRGILSAGRAAAARAGSRAGRDRGRRRAAALRGRPADHLRAESSARQAEASAGAEASRRKGPAVERHAASAAPQKTDGN